MTGIWSLLEVGTDLPDGYNVTLGIKLLLVVAAGGSAAAHSWSSSKLVKGVTGALGGLMGILIMFLGSLLAHSA
jgi:hypothetical protein